jgi:hypothetical protein
MIDVGIIEKWTLSVSSGEQEQLNALWAELMPFVQELAEEWLEKSLRRVPDDSVDSSLLRDFLEQLKNGELRFRGSDELWRLIASAALRRLEAGDGVGNSTEFSAQMARASKTLLDELADADMESVALFKLNGNTNDEIARSKNCTRRTIQRMLKLIRDIWEGHIGL